MKTLFLQCSIQLSSFYKSFLNIPTWKYWLFPLTLLSPSCVTSFCPHYITLYGHYVHVLWYISIWFISSLWVGSENVSSLDPAQHLAHSLISNYSWMKKRVAGYSLSEKKRCLLESLALNRLTGITWLTKRSGYTHCPRKLRIKGGSLWIFRVRRKSITTNPPEADCLKWI